MADISNEYGVDPLTGDRIAVDPPLQESATPLMGNPVLMRGTKPRKAKSNTALYAGAAIAVIAVLAGGTYLIASSAHQRSDLMTNTPTTPPPVQEAAAAPPPAALTSSSVMAPAPLAPVVASAETPVQPLHAPRIQRAEAVRHAERREAAKAAEDSGADASASVTPSQAVQPSVATPQPAPTQQAPSAPMVAPQAEPVISPPPAQ